MLTASKHSKQNVRKQNKNNVVTWDLDIERRAENGTQLCGTKRRDAACASPRMHAPSNRMRVVPPRLDGDSWPPTGALELLRMCARESCSSSSPQISESNGCINWPRVSTPQQNFQKFKFEFNLNCELGVRALINLSLSGNAHLYRLDVERFLSEDALCDGQANACSTRHVY